MNQTEALDMNTMCEALKIADQLERTAAHLRLLGSNPRCIEAPTLEVLEHLPPDTKFFAPGSDPLGGATRGAIQIGLVLEEARDEVKSCALKLGELSTRWFDVDED